jgi:multisubunit Na+/H+ antiporter MnhF subunit
MVVKRASRVMTIGLLSYVGQHSILTADSFIGDNEMLNVIMIIMLLAGVGFLLVAKFWYTDR